MENGQGGGQNAAANESAMDEQSRNMRRALPSERELVRDNMKSKSCSRRVSVSVFCRSEERRVGKECCSQ